jgi:P pilus assembly chaperone PapD
MLTTLTAPPDVAKHTWWGLLISLLSILALASNLTAGVLVAPTLVLLSDKNRTARLDINNPGATPQEVTINFAYGLPESDSLGNVRVILQDSSVTDPRSAMAWVKAFPRQLVLPPNGTQVVRFVINPPKGLADGEYWARVVVRSKESQQSIPMPTEAGAITTKLNMIMQTAIMLKYRTGALNSSVAMTGSSAIRTDSSIVMTMNMENLGNVSYVGVLSCRLLDSNKKEISRAQTDLAVYRQLRRRLELPLKGLTGRCAVEVSVTTEGRTDVAPNDIIPGNKVYSTVEVE